MRLFKKNRLHGGQGVQRFSWRGMYENGGSLRLAAAISAEMARAVTLELSGKLYGSERAELLNGAFSEILKSANEFCEIACALGGVMLKPYFANGRISTCCIPPDAFEVTQLSPDGAIRGARFFESIEKDGRSYTKCEEHGFFDGRYIITNTVWQTDNPSKQMPLDCAKGWAELEPRIELEGIENPLFAYFKMPFVNISDLSSPFGVPVYARAVELIDDAQKQYDRIKWEFESGERALYLDESAFRRNIRGEIQLPDRRLYRLLSTGNDELFCDWTPQLRDEALINGFERILQRVEFNCGLAYGTLSDPQTVDKTAEEIRASKQRSYATVTQIQTALKTALGEWVQAAGGLADICMFIPEGEVHMEIMFDDSIITDRSAEFGERMQLLASGVITAEEMRAWYLGRAD